MRSSKGLLVITVTVRFIDVGSANCQSPRMARLARIVVPGVPHHVTQRGNGRQQTFFGADDYTLYRDPLGRAFMPIVPAPMTA